MQVQTNTRAIAVSNLVVDELTSDQISKLQEQLQAEQSQIVERIRQAELSEPVTTADVVDRATLEEERALQTAAIYRLSKRLKEIGLALRKIDEGEYGYCEETGEPIGFGRLSANPACRYSIFVQEKREKLGFDR